MMVKPASSITRDASITCAGSRAGLEHLGDRVERRIGRGVQIAIKRAAALAERE